MSDAWDYCPECGHLESTETGYDNGRFCDSCGQEWFPDVNYSKVVIAKLGELTAANERIRELEASSRFFLDHGLWHDKVTGQHVYTQDQYDDLRREAFHHGYSAALAAEREVSDKLEKALREAAKHLWHSFDNDNNAAKADATLAEVAAIRATHTSGEQA